MELLDLPNEILFEIFSFLPIEDFLRFAQTCERLHSISYSKGLWTNLSFGVLSPIPSTQRFYERAAAAGNYEAAILLAVGAIYGVGVGGSADLAGEMLMRAEVCAAQPVTWALYRPPWSSLECSKARIFHCIRQQAYEFEAKGMLREAGKLFYCIHKTIRLSEHDEIRQLEREVRPSPHPCAQAVLDAAALLPPTSLYDDSRCELLSRHLHLGYPVKMALARDLCARRPLPRLSLPLVAELVSDVGITARPYRVLNPLWLVDITMKMRAVLLDWLVEVAVLKQFSRETLMLTFSLVDRAIKRVETSRRTLQLMGISCLVTAARYMEEGVVTIREAAWLTDNTYSYEDVVGCLGKVLAASRGALLVPTPLEFLDLFLALFSPEMSLEEKNYFYYVLEMTLLRFTMDFTSPAKMAAMVFVITRVLRDPMNSAGQVGFEYWPVVCEEASGLSLLAFLPSLLGVYETAFLKDASNALGDKLGAIDERYEKIMGVNPIHSLNTSLDVEEVALMLGGPAVLQSADSTLRSLLDPYGLVNWELGPSFKHSHKEDTPVKVMELEAGHETRPLEHSAHCAVRPCDSELGVSQQRQGDRHDDGLRVQRVENKDRSFDALPTVSPCSSSTSFISQNKFSPLNMLADFAMPPCGVHVPHLRSSSSSSSHLGGAFTPCIPIVNVQFSADQSSDVGPEESEHEPALLPATHHYQEDCEQDLHGPLPFEAQPMSSGDELPIAEHSLPLGSITNAAPSRKQKRRKEKAMSHPPYTATSPKSRPSLKH